MAGFLKLMRSEKTEELFRHRNAFVLLALIAYRSRRTEGSLDDLKPGQALIGDHKSCGLTRQEYRSATNLLKKRQIITTEPTTRGTVATLIDSDIWDANSDFATTEPTGKQPSSNHQATTNKKGKKGKNIEKEKVEKESAQLEFVGSEAEPPSAPIFTFPCNGKVKQFPITAAFLKELCDTYPGLNVEGEIQKALAKIENGAVSKKTAKGMPRFLFSWMDRAQNRPHGNNSNSQTSAKTTREQYERGF